MEICKPPMLHLVGLPCERYGKPPGFDTSPACLASQAKLKEKFPEATSYFPAYAPEFTGEVIIVFASSDDHEAAFGHALKWVDETRLLPLLLLLPPTPPSRRALLLLLLWGSQNRRGAGPECTGGVCEPGTPWRVAFQGRAFQGPLDAEDVEEGAPVPACWPPSRKASPLSPMTCARA